MASSAPYRLVQAMVVAEHTATKKANSLEVFCVPPSERDAFHAFLKKEDEDLAALMKSGGFTKLGSRRRLDKAAKAFGNKDVGWRLVPMRSNTVVFFCGPHMVHHGKKSTGFRTVQYLQILPSPLYEELPEDWDAEKDAAQIAGYSGKSLNTAVESAFSDFYSGDYGWNKKTIPEEHWKVFAGPKNTSSQDSAFITRLHNKGFIVLHNALPRQLVIKLSYTIKNIVRTVLFKLDRKGLTPEILHYVGGLSDNKLAKRLNEPRLKRARYFKTNTIDCYRGYEDKRELTCLQGVQGITLSSQMVDITAHPVFAEVCIALAPKLNRLFRRQVYFGKERCSLRSSGALGLGPHIDDPFLGV